MSQLYFEIFIIYKVDDELYIYIYKYVLLYFGMAVWMYNLYADKISKRRER